MSKIWAMIWVLVVLAGESAAADPVPEIVLTVTASAKETALSKGGRNAEPVTLTFHFKNVSDKAQKLDISRIERHLLSLKVTGPDGNLVPATFTAKGPAGSEPLFGVELKELATGDAWEMTKVIPGIWSKRLGGEAEFVFDQTGKYKTTAVDDGAAAAKGAWRGTVTSKVVEIQVNDAGK